MEPVWKVSTFCMGVIGVFYTIAEAKIADDTPDVTLEINQVNAAFGYSVEGVGDLNGDGIDDFAVGAVRYDDTITDEGGVFIYYGNGSGISTSPDTTLTSGTATPFFGAQVAGAGDVNGDGYGDLAVAAPYAKNDGILDQGAIYVYYGSASGVSNSPDVVINGIQQSQFIGELSRGWGDLNGDGYDDLVYGDYGALSHPDLTWGSLYIHYGSASGLSASFDSVIHSTLDSSSELFGTDVVVAGDLNNDGFDDVAVGAEWNSQITKYGGAVYIFYGSASGLSQTARYVIYGENYQEYLGSSVGAAGDVDKDGIDDLIVGAPGHTVDQADEGVVYLFFGTASGPIYSHYTLKDADSSLGNVGEKISGMGDVNGDGMADIVTNGLYGHVFTGGNQLDQRSDLTVKTFPTSVAMLGDVNNDGYDDVAMGDTSYSNGENQEGVVYVYYGGPTVPASGNVDDGVDPGTEKPDDDGSDKESDDGKPQWKWKRDPGGNGTGTFRVKLDDDEMQYGYDEITEKVYTPKKVLTPGKHTLFVQEKLVNGTWSAATPLTVTVNAQVVPTLSEWGMIILTLLMAGLAMVRTGKTPRQAC